MMVPVTDAVAMKVPFEFSLREANRPLCAVQGKFVDIGGSNKLSMLTTMNSPDVGEEEYAKIVGLETFDTVIMPEELIGVLIFVTVFIPLTSIM
jgi:hypothetical protein